MRKEFDKMINAAVKELKVSYDEAVNSIREDYAQTTADIRNDFIDCFINGDISGMIEAAHGKKRMVDVDFCPVFEEMDKLKQHVNALVESEVIQAINTVRKDQGNFRDETSRLLVDLTDSVSNDISKVADQVQQTVGAMEKLSEQAGTLDLNPVLEAIDRVNVQSDVAALKDAVDTVQGQLQGSEAKLRTELQRCQTADFANLESLLSSSMDNTLESMRLDNLVLLNAVAGTSLDISDQLDCISKVGLDSIQRISKQENDLHKMRDVLTNTIASSSKKIEDRVQEASEKKPKVEIDFSPVLNAVGKIDLNTVINRVDATSLEISKQVKDPSNLQPVLRAIQALDFNVDLSPALESTERVLEKVTHVEAQQGALQALLQVTKDVTTRTEAKIPQPTDLTPVLTAIGEIEVQPQVNIDLQSVLDAVTEVGRAADARAEEAINDELNGRKALSGALAELESANERRLHEIADELVCLKGCLKLDIDSARDEIKVEMGNASHETVARILGVTTVASAQSIVSLREVTAAVNAIKPPDIQGVLEALKSVDEAVRSIDFSPVSTQIDRTYVDLLTAVKKNNTDLRPILEAIKTNGSGMAKSFEDLQRLDVKLQRIDEILADIDSKPPVDLDPLHEVSARIDSKLSVDVQTVLDAVSAIDFKPVVKVDTRPVIDAMNAGLANIEIAWAKVDLKDVTSMLKKIDNRLLEAHVKIDAKHPNRTHNFIWASEAAQWS
jgi:hypothetical protein